MKNWLTLSDYSTKYKVSISTLRRRIKKDDVVTRFQDGKYFLKDVSLNEQKVKSKPSGSFAPPQVTEEPEQTFSMKTEKKHEEREVSPFLSATQEMLGELKKAYSIILQEKQEQVMLLRDEVADLRTLVSVLEEENTRLKEKMTDSLSLESWLTSASPES